MKRIRILAVILLMMMIFSGCGSREASSPDPGNKTETGSSAVNEDEADNEATEPSEGSGRETDARDVEIYYIDDATGEMVTETAEIKDEDDIWSQLQKKGVLTEECRMLSSPFQWSASFSTIRSAFFLVSVKTMTRLKVSLSARSSFNRLIFVAMFGTS